MRTTGRLLFCFVVMLASARAAIVTRASASISGECSASDVRTGTTYAEATATCGNEWITALALSTASVTVDNNPAAFAIELNTSAGGSAFGIGEARASGSAEYDLWMAVFGGAPEGEITGDLTYGGYGGNIGSFQGGQFEDVDFIEIPVAFAYQRGVPFRLSMSTAAFGGEPEGMPPDPGGSRLRVVLSAPGASIVVIPEPGSLALIAIGSILLVCRRSLRAKSS